MIIDSNLVSSEIQCTVTKNHKIFIRTTKPHKSNKKTQDLLLNSSSGNRVLFIAGYRPAQEFESVIQFTLCPVAYAENFHGWVHLVAYGSHLYLVCVVCEITI